MRRLLPRNKPIIKLTELWNHPINWINEDEVWTLFQDDYKGNQFTKENDMVQTLNKLFNQDLKVVKERFINNFTKKYKNIDNTYVKVKKKVYQNSEW